MPMLVRSWLNHTHSIQVFSNSSSHSSSGRSGEAEGNYSLICGKALLNTHTDREREYQRHPHTQKLTYRNMHRLSDLNHISGKGGEETLACRLAASFIIHAEMRARIMNSYCICGACIYVDIVWAQICVGSVDRANIMSSNGRVETHISPQSAAHHIRTYSIT